jgi:hypothetical protein
MSEETVLMSLVEQQIAEHENQFAMLETNFQQLETEFNQKKEWALKTLEQLRGAVLALRGLKELSQADTKSPEEPSPVTE